MTQDDTMSAIEDKPVEFQWKVCSEWISGGGTEDNQRYAKSMADRIGEGYRELYSSATVEALKAEIARLTAERDAAEFAARNGRSLSEDSIAAIRELLTHHGVPTSAFIDDHVGNAIAQRDEARAQLSALKEGKGVAKDASPDRFTYWNSLPESKKEKIRQSFHDDMFGGTDD